jgi:hypothetical protein
MSKKIATIILAMMCTILILAGCSSDASNPIQSPATTQTALAEATPAPSEAEADPFLGLRKIIFHRGSDKLTETHDEASFYEVFKPLITDTQNLLYIAQRGGAGIDDSRREEKLAKDIEVLADSDDGSQLGYSYFRLEYPPYIPEPGQNGLGYQDLILYEDPQNKEDAYIGIQNPKQLDKWTIIALPGYGQWLNKELDIHLRACCGF